MEDRKQRDRVTIYNIYITRNVASERIIVYSLIDVCKVNSRRQKVQVKKETEKDNQHGNR